MTQVERLLCGVDAAVYLLDYTKLKTAEEAAMLGRLRSLNPELVRRLCTRLFFVVNKLDAADTAGGLGEDETREYVAQVSGGALCVFDAHDDARISKLAECHEKSKGFWRPRGDYSSLLCSTPHSPPQEVTRQLSLPGFILHPDQVILISARDALLSRLILSG